MLSMGTQRLIQFERMAVLTDFGPESEDMLRYSAGLARWYGAKLMLVHAARPEPPVHAPVHAPPQPLSVWPAGSPGQTQNAEARLNSLTLKLGLQDLSPQVVVRHEGVLALLRDVEMYHPSLLVLATHGRQGVKKWLMGSITEEVFRRVQWPVMVLGPQVDLERIARRQQFESVVYATDLSGVSVTALQFAAAIAHDQEAQLVAVHVEHDPHQGFAFDHTMALQRLEDWLHDRIDGLSDALAGVKCVVEFGKPAAKIESIADAEKADLIVMGARGLGAAVITASHFLGGTAYDVICAARCPVLIVPQPR